MHVIVEDDERVGAQHGAFRVAPRALGRFQPRDALDGGRGRLAVETTLVYLDGIDLDGDAGAREQIEAARRPGREHERHARIISFPDLETRRD